MPGYELINYKERNAINKLFDESGILFAHGFDNLRKKYHVREFEKAICRQPLSGLCQHRSVANLRQVWIDTELQRRTTHLQIALAIHVHNWLESI